MAGTGTGTNVAGIALFVLLIGLLPLALRELPREEKEPRKPKVYTRVLGEDLRVTRRGLYGIDVLRCGACRLEKRRRGPLTFGGLNVLVLEDLHVVLPEAPVKETAQGAEPADTATAEEILGNMGVGRDFLRAHGVSWRFSGLRVERLAVSRLEGTNVVEVFAASAGEAKRDGLHLRECAIISGVASNVVEDAVLKVKPALRLCWRGNHEMHLCTRSQEMK